MKQRLFIAINLPPKIKAEIFDAVEALRKKNPRLEAKWVEEENLHLTLHFLGYVEEEKIPALIKDLEKSVRSFSSFSLNIGQAGGFPSVSRPRVIFIKTAEPTGTLKNIHRTLGQILEKHNIKIDKRPYQGHITLTRLKFPVAVCGLEKTGEKISFDCPIKSVDLMQSCLSRSGPTYMIVKSFNLT
ncbi:MAG: RNA 2',3'-cyclic phosphodiesterase [bacterium]|nr:RNA 2',3'-cyclic phosphodiesterase [bacterium]